LLLEETLYLRPSCIYIGVATGCEECCDRLF